jgi:hypothetical protein
MPGQLHDPFPGAVVQSNVADQFLVLFGHPGSVSGGTHEEVSQVRWKIERVSVARVHDVRQALQSEGVLVTAVSDDHRSILARTLRFPVLSRLLIESG